MKIKLAALVASTVLTGTAADAAMPPPRLDLLRMGYGEIAHGVCTVPQTNNNNSITRAAYDGKTIKFYGRKTKPGWFGFRSDKETLEAVATGNLSQNPTFIINRKKMSLDSMTVFRTLVAADPLQAVQQIIGYSCNRYTL